MTHHINIIPLFSFEDIDKWQFILKVIRTIETYVGVG